MNWKGHSGTGCSIQAWVVVLPAFCGSWRKAIHQRNSTTHPCLWSAVCWHFTSKDISDWDVELSLISPGFLIVATFTTIRLQNSVFCILYILYSIFCNLYSVLLTSQLLQSQRILSCCSTKPAKTRVMLIPAPGCFLPWDHLYFLLFCFTPPLWNVPSLLWQLSFHRGWSRAWTGATVHLLHSQTASAQLTLHPWALPSVEIHLIFSDSLLVFKTKLTGLFPFPDTDVENWRIQVLMNAFVLNDCSRS